MALNTRFWIRFSLFNLLIVALLGTIMRYKIGFEFPYLNQKHIQHAHSHFAFIGWITHTLFVLMVHVIQKQNLTVNGNFYRKLIICNLVLAYSMLFSFAAQGYGFFSITFSTLSVLNSYVFAVRIFKDLKPLKDQPYTYWFIAALWFNIISSLGTFNLGFMMASHNFNQNYHLASLYFYLHFQYNGFFTFACIGLLLSQLYGQKSDCRQNSSVFWLFFSSCIPAYFLSVLWATLPLWIYVLMVAAAITQLIGWIRLLKIIKKQLKVNPALPKLGRYLFLILTIAVSAKFLLQLGSTIPWVSKLAFGFRPIVIAYLHLILLAIISVFIVTYLYIYKFLAINKMTTAALILFVSGVYLNELVLGVQGIASFSYTVVPYVNETLFGIAVLIVLGLGLLLLSQRQSKRRIPFTSAMRRF
jgi:hypothetical protein